MARTSAVRKPKMTKNEGKQKTEGKRKTEDQVKYMCDVCGRVVYTDMFGDYEEEDLMCCGELMTEQED